MAARKDTSVRPAGAFPPVDRLGQALGELMYDLVRELYPINRSITGDGLRMSLKMIGEIIDLAITEVPTGTKVFDWAIPREWTVREAYIENENGDRIVDFHDNNLHIVSYSAPVNERMTLDELRPHLHSLPDQPDWIPYRTAYYDENWGFCLAYNELSKIKDGTYKVVIDSDLKAGSLSYGECVVPGRSDNEVLFFSHICHPSLCNDNLSGVVLSTYLADTLKDTDTFYTYRFLFAPATIGSIAWLAQNEKSLDKIHHGLVLSVIGDTGFLRYKRSRRGHAHIDRAVEQVLSTTADRFEIRKFSPWGYDERQFCSPGLNLPIGRLTRTPNGEYPEYHTSADDLSIVRPDCLLDSMRAVWRVIQVLEGNSVYLNRVAKGEPQLGRRGLYRKLGGYQDIERQQLAMLWVLNQSDGQHSLLDIAEMAELPFDVIRSAANDLVDADLLEAIQLIDA